MSTNTEDNTLSDILGSLRRRGIRLWLQNGELRYAAPKGVITPFELETLRAYKGQIARFLERVNELQLGEPQTESRPRRDRAPLTFSQVAYWNEQHLHERHVRREVASSTRLQGPLNVDVLRRCIAEMVQRHEALRSRIVHQDGILVQEIDEIGNSELVIIDLTHLQQSEQQFEVPRLISEHIEEKINVGTDPAFASSLLRLSQHEHVLTVSTVHTVADAVSRNILIRDIFSAYQQMLQDNTIALPLIPMQFADFAFWQQKMGERLAQKCKSWSQHLSGCDRLRLPRDKQSGITNPSQGLGIIRLSIGSDSLSRLRECCRVMRTTPTMAMFTAFACFVLCWCDVAEGVFQYITDGRFGKNIQNTVGYFAFPLYLRVVLSVHDTFVDLLRKVTDEYCDAYEHLDYGCLKISSPQPAFVNNPSFNWGSQGPSTSLFDLELSEGALTGTFIPYRKDEIENFDVDEEPKIVFLERPEEILGAVTYPLNGISSKLMQRFCDEFLAFTHTMLQDTHQRIRPIAMRRSSSH